MAQEGFVVKKLWGREVYITNTTRFCCKELHVEAMKVCSRHRHHIKDEFFRVLHGTGCIEVNDQIYLMEQGDYLHIPHDTWHRFWSTTGMVIQEISSHHQDSDVERDRPSEAILRGKDSRDGG